MQPEFRPLRTASDHNPPDHQLQDRCSSHESDDLRCGERPHAGSGNPPISSEPDPYARQAEGVILGPCQGPVVGRHQALDWGVAGGPGTGSGGAARARALCASCGGWLGRPDLAALRWRWPRALRAMTAWGSCSAGAGKEAGLPGRGARRRLQGRGGHHQPAVTLFARAANGSASFPAASPEIPAASHSRTRRRCSRSCASAKSKRPASSSWPMVRARSPASPSSRCPPARPQDHLEALAQIGPRIGEHRAQPLRRHRHHVGRRGDGGGVARRARSPRARA